MEHGFWTTTHKINNNNNNNNNNNITVYKQLQSHLDAAGLMPNMQSAYRKGHSTETKVRSDIITAMDKGHYVLLALDLSTAFDTVDYDILLEHSARLGLGLAAKLPHRTMFYCQALSL